MRRLVHAFKYGGRRDVLPFLGERMAASPRLGPGLRGRRDTVLVAVPARREARRRRGYDQALGLARGLAAAAHLRLEAGALRRRRETGAAQSASPGSRRRQQLRAAFAARPALVAGQRLVLVDDVMSTGATADAASRALLAAGARSVHVAVLAT